MKLISSQSKRLAVAVLCSGLAAGGVLTVFSRVVQNRAGKQPDGQSGRPELVLQLGHSGLVRALAFAPDGKMLASGGEDGAINLWDAHSGELLRSLEGHTGWLVSLKFSPDGTTLVSGGGITTRLWDVKTGLLLHNWDNQGNITAAVLSPDGQTIAVGGMNHIKLWDVPTKKERRQLEGHDYGLSALAFAPDGSTLVSGGSRRDGNTHVGELKFWDVPSGTLRRTLPGFDGNEKQIAFSSDGSTLAFGAVERVPPKGDGTDVTINGVPQGSSNYIIQLWDVQNARVRQTLRGCEFSVYSLAFSADGSTLVSGDMYNMVRIWDVAAGTQRHAMRVGTQLNPVVITPDGAIVASVGRREDIKLWNAQTGAVLRGLPGRSGGVSHIVFSRDGRTLAHAHSESYRQFSVRLWDAQTGKLLQTREVLGYVTELAFEPDDKTLRASLAYYEGDESEVWWWEARSGTLKRWEKLPTGKTLSGIKLADAPQGSPDGKITALASRDGAVQLRDATIGATTNSLLVTLLILPRAADEKDEKNKDREAPALSTQWIAYTPQGHYDGSPGAEKWIRWRVGEQVVLAKKYSATFHRPEKVQNALHRDN